MMTDLTKPKCEMAVAKLSPQMVAVLRCMMEGLATKQIADRLELSEGTVRTYRELIFSRLGVNNVGLAVRVASVAGIRTELKIEN